MRRTSRLLITAGFALAASMGLALAKDSVVIGMVLEPPGLDPTTGAAAAIGEIVHYNIFEGLTKINEDFSVTPLLADELDVLARSQDADLQAEAGRQVPGRRALHLQGREVLLRARRRARIRPTRTRRSSPRSSRSRRPTRRPSSCTSRTPSFDALFHLGLNTAVIIDEKSAADRRRRRRSAPALTSSTAGPRARRSRSTSGTATATPARSRSNKATFRFINDPAAQVAALLAGDVDAFPRFASVQSLDQFKSDPRFQVTDRRHRGQDDPGDQQQEEAVRRPAGAPGDRLRDRPQGDHRRRDERPRRRRSAAISCRTIPAMST